MVVAVEGLVAFAAALPASVAASAVFVVAADFAAVRMAVFALALLAVAVSLVRHCQCRFTGIFLLWILCRPLSAFWEGRILCCDGCLFCCTPCCCG